MADQGFEVQPLSEKELRQQRLIKANIPKPVIKGVVLREDIVPGTQDPGTIVTGGASLSQDRETKPVVADGRRFAGITKPPVRHS